MMNDYNNDQMRSLEKTTPAGISWGRDQVLCFLRMQYAEGNPKAEELLKLQLWIEVQKKIDADDSRPSTESDSYVRGMIESVAGFPASIAKTVFDDHLNRARRFSFAGETRPDADFRECDTIDEDDIPF